MPLTDFDTIAYEDQTVRKVVKYTDMTAGVAKLPILAGRFVKNVRVETLAAFDTSTAVIVGDSTDDNAFILTGALDPATPGSVENSLNNSGAFEEGHSYPSGGVLVITNNGTDVASGSYAVYITYDGYAPVARGMVDHQNPTYGKGDMETTAWSGAADQTVPPAIP